MRISEELNRIREIRHRLASKLMSYPNVTGLAVGYKYSKGRRTKTLGITVFVKKKKPLSVLRTEEIVPQQLEGVTTDIVEVRFKRFQSEHRQRHDNLVGGISIGRLSVTGSGTLAMSVLDNETLEDVMLSNWHVLCASSACSKGDLIIQPGSGDGDSGNSNDVVGNLYKWRLNSEVDAAGARSNSDRNFFGREILGISVVDGSQIAEVGMSVKKSGRTTGVTSGEIILEDAEVLVGGYDGGDRTFQNQFIVDGVSDFGDSGSAVINDKNRIVGLLFAGGEDSTDNIIYIANHISNVEDALGITAGFSESDLIAININLLL